VQHNGHAVKDRRLSDVSTRRFEGARPVQ